MATPLASFASPSLAATVAAQLVPSPSSKQLAVSQISSCARVGFARARSSRLVVAAVGESSTSGPVSAEEKASSSSENVTSLEDASDASPTQPTRTFSPTACQACGKEDKVGGCNGEGRILGGLSSVPGFGWFPIKAYRPCPAFVEAGGRYRRQGQSLEEVAFGRMGKQDELDITERLQGGKEK